MSAFKILFYGASGIETRILQSYLTASGYEAQFFSSPDEILASIEAHPLAVAIVAAEKTPAELFEFARQIRAHSGRGHIFLLTDNQPSETVPERVEVIARPFQLSALVLRLRNLTDDDNAPSS